MPFRSGDRDVWGRGREGSGGVWSVQALGSTVTEYRTSSLKKNWLDHRVQVMKDNITGYSSSSERVVAECSDSR